jgi:membrane protein insertase Oxa1/YidC/SpoIIIJ
LLTIFIQLPIILGLYFVFLHGGLPNVEIDLLYSFVHIPSFSIEPMFLGVIDMLGKSMPLAVLAGVTQHMYARYTFARVRIQKDTSKGQSFQEDIARAMQTQVLYVLPVLIVVFGYITSAAVALYWVTSNICSVVQEWYVQRTLHTETEEKITPNTDSVHNKRI